MIRILTVCLVVLLAACAPEVGSEKWCENMEDQPKGDWTGNEAKAYAKYCILGNYVDDKD
ncbi:MAG: DUF3012 domain-containing protein [Deltaproteobacteria bacterium]|nr:DUF3012 domain-containing protein [Deltaproteobacteria bacterium]